VATTWLHYATDCSREKKSGRASEMQPELLSKPQRFPATPHGFFSIVSLIFCGIETCIARA